jgi:electron transfer flavoprotein alpha subunit
VFKPPTANPQHKAKIEVLDIKVNPVAVRTKILESVTEMQAGELKVDEAEMVVSCGRGIKAPENIPLIAQLAKELSAAIGGSRPIVDAGWMKHHQQVGQSGRTISPKLYIACGISGAIQHLAGIQGGAETIVAVNTDPEAPIFTIADFGIVGDLFKVVPALVKEIQRAKTHK